MLPNLRRFACGSLVAALLLVLAGKGGLCAELHAGSDQAQAAFERGEFSEAATRWQEAVTSFHQTGNTNGQIDATLHLAAAYQALGHQRRAEAALEEALNLAVSVEDHSRISIVKSRLGAALVMTLQLDRAETLLKEALERAQAEKVGGLQASILNDQGTLLVNQQKYEQALAAFAESVLLARAAGNTLLAAQALSNAAATAAQAGAQPNADGLNAEALQAADVVAPSHQKAFLLIKAAQTDRQLQAAGGAGTNRFLSRAHRSLEKALEIGQNLKDRAVMSYALGYLGQLYEQDKQLDAALSLTKRATFSAQQGQLTDVLYRWDWQTGRLLKAKGEIQPAIEAYRRAVQTLQPIRHDLSLGYGNASTRLSFREASGPLFFELADLLLGQSESADREQAQLLLREARDTVEQLKAVELEDYLQDDCVNVLRAKTKSLDVVDPQTAIIYFIPLAERTELLVSLASGISRFTAPVGVERLTAEVRQFRRNLETRTSYGYLEQAQQLYDWLIRPMRELLAQGEVSTLVFVPDGPLRTIPFASLQDGKRFLIQDMAIAVAPGLSLIEPHPIQRERVRLLLSGLSQSVQGFPKLQYVPGELQSIEPLYRSETLLNEDFMLSALSRRLTTEQYSIVHIASHGQFDRDVRKTFILTYDTKLTLNGLEALIRPGQYRGKPVELLVLSACQTAAGDDRAALGLAGVAVKAGARSALATLWFVNDQSTSALITEMYDQLHRSPNITKAKALQAAQIKLLSDRRYRHPCYWAPYLLIGNWL